jgi:hypothetical protein
VRLISNKMTILRVRKRDTGKRGRCVQNLSREIVQTEKKNPCPMKEIKSHHAVHHVFKEREMFAMNAA